MEATQPEMMLAALMSAACWLAFGIFTADLSFPGKRDRSLTRRGSHGVRGSLSSPRASAVSRAQHDLLHGRRCDGAIGLAVHEDNDNALLCSPLEA